MIYLNMKTGAGVETVDELNRKDFPNNQGYWLEVLRLQREYRLAGMPVYMSSRSTNEWRLRA